MRAGWGGYSPGEGVWLSDCCVCRNIDHFYTLQKSQSVLAADVFGTGIFHWHIMPWCRYQSRVIIAFRRGWNEFFRFLGCLRGVRWFYADVSGLPIGLNFKGQASSWKAWPLNNPENGRTQVLAFYLFSQFLTPQVSSCSHLMVPAGQLYKPDTIPLWESM
jgi:hypothetical protein